MTKTAEIQTSISTLLTEISESKEKRLTLESVEDFDEEFGDTKVTYRLGISKVFPCQQWLLFGEQILNLGIAVKIERRV